MYKRVYRWLNRIVLIGGASLVAMPWFVRQEQFGPYAGGFGNVGFNTSCQQYWASGIQDSIDMCFFLDCEQPWAGGAFDPCGENPLLQDCVMPVLDMDDLEEQENGN